MPYTPSLKDVEVVGRWLFDYFIEEELSKEGIPGEVLETEEPPPDVFEGVNPGVMHGEGDIAGQEASQAFAVLPGSYKTVSSTQLGRCLRECAEQFAQSPERRRIKGLANGVNLQNISYDTFLPMLSELFRKGIDKIKIVALFVFCADVLTRCINGEHYKLGRKLFFWSLIFLFDVVCKWVHAHGGWERVFSNIYTVVYRVGVLALLGVGIGCGCIGICCGCIYIKNKIRN